MRDIDEMTPAQISSILESKITYAIKTAKRTPKFKIYLDMLNATYIQVTALSEMIKAADRLATDDNEC